MTKATTEGKIKAKGKASAKQPEKKPYKLSTTEKGLIFLAVSSVLSVGIWEATLEYTGPDREPAPEGYHYARWSDALYVIVFVALITFVRYAVLDKFIFQPMCVFVEKESEYVKFRESAFKLVMYSFVLAFGIYAVYDEDYLFDHEKIWLGFPSHPIKDLTGIYYLLELAYNIHMLITVFVDVKRKDFAEYIIHHFATVFLIVFSYTVGYTRVGVLVLLAHDPSDVALELGKCCKYFGFKRLPDFVFGLFVLSWIVFRLYAYSYIIAYKIYLYGFEVISNFSPHPPMAYFFGILLWILVVLHHYWFLLIVRMVYRMAIVGAVEKDIRSDSESDHED